MITLVDNFGGTLPIFVLAIFELIAIFYFYGLENLCIDIEFMTKRHVTFYWRICWYFFAPLIMTIVYVYSSITMKPLKYAGLDYPNEYLIVGWCIFIFAMIQLPIWFLFRYMRSPMSAKKAFVNIFKSTTLWGPRKETDRNSWMKYREEVKLRNRTIANGTNHSKMRKAYNLAFGNY